MNDANPTILLVDDQRSGIDTLLEYLADTPYTLVTTPDCQSAWEMLEAAPDQYDTVILDCAISGPDGLHILEQMRRHPVLQDVPAILQTGSADESALPGGLLAGGWSCLVKPFDQAQLLDAVATALQNRVAYRPFHVDGYLVDQTLGLLREATFTLKTRHAARDLARLLAHTFPQPQRAVIGLAELLLNAVEHGNLRISYEEKKQLRQDDRWEEEVASRLADPANADKAVWVEYSREPKRIRVRIRDQGDGFDWHRYVDVDPARATDLNGRGIALARMISFDSMEFHGNGNEVEVTVEIPGS